MGTRSNYYKAALAAHEFLDSTYAKPTTQYLALLKSAAAAGASGATINEATATGYARKAIAVGSSDWSFNSTTNEVTNDNEIAFATMSASPDESYTHWAILDSGTIGAGNVKHAGAFSDSIDVNSLDHVVKIPPGDLVVQYL